MFTIAEVNAAQPPNSPIGSSAYWQGILKASEQQVKLLCGRQLESDDYSDVGYTVKQTNSDNTKVHVYYLNEPTGTLLTFAALTAFTLNDTTVAEAEVVIEVKRLVFNTPGEVKVTYAGGYLADTTHKAVLLQAVIASMHALHAYLQGGGSRGGFGGRYYGPDLSAIESMLLPYTVIMIGEYTEGPA